MSRTAPILSRIAWRNWHRKSILSASSNLSEQRDRLSSGLTLAPCLRPLTGRYFSGPVCTENLHPS